MYPAKVDDDVKVVVDAETIEEDIKKIKKITIKPNLANDLLSLNHVNLGCVTLSINALIASDDSISS